MFLAIINDTYSSVKEESADAANEFEVMDFFKGVSALQHFLKFFYLSDLNLLA